MDSLDYDDDCSPAVQREVKILQDLLGGPNVVALLATVRSPDGLAPRGPGAWGGGRELRGAPRTPPSHTVYLPHSEPPCPSSPRRGEGGGTPSPPPPEPRGPGGYPHPRLPSFLSNPAISFFLVAIPTGAPGGPSRRWPSSTWRTSTTGSCTRPSPPTTSATTPSSSSGCVSEDILMGYVLSVRPQMEVSFLFPPTLSFGCPPRSSPAVRILLSSTSMCHSNRSGGPMQGPPPALGTVAASFPTRHAPSLQRRSFHPSRRACIPPPRPSILRRWPSRTPRASCTAT